jgi:riboflavin kinase/FMN adenylyltransferase
MKTLRLSGPAQHPVRCCLALGKFDGFHAGHRKIVATLQKCAIGDAVPAVFTFRTFPAEFCLSTWNERLALFKEAGVELCLWADFDEVRHWSAQEFLDRLRLFCAVQGLVVGENFRFGAGREGTVLHLSAWAREQGAKMTVVKPVRRGGRTISSSSIRAMLKHARFTQAATFLGRRFSLTGRVEHGAEHGARLGFPTANLSLENPVPLPDGVYAGIAVLGKGRALEAVAFSGPAQTFERKQSIFEVHIPGFSGTLYGTTLKFYPVAFLRGPAKFPSPEALQNAIAGDVAKARARLARLDLTSFSPQGTL